MRRRHLTFSELDIDALSDEDRNSLPRRIDLMIDMPLEDPGKGCVVSSGACLALGLLVGFGRSTPVRIGR